MNRNYLFLLLILIGGLPSSWAQEAKGGIVRPKAGDTWSLEALDPKERTPVPALGITTDKSGQNASGVLLETNSMGPDFREQTFWIDGEASFQRWVKGGYVFYKSSPETFEIEPHSSEIKGGPVTANRLAEFDWVAPRWQQGSATVDGVECLIYLRPWPETSVSTPTATAYQLAAIGKADGYPRRLEVPHSIHRYTWKKIPPPTFPEGATASLRDFELELKRQETRHNVAR